MNIKKFTCFFTILFSIIFTNCFAVSKWTFIQQDNQGQKTYVDNFGKKKSGNMVILWVLQDYKKAKQENNKRWYSEKSENIFDCPGRVYRKIQFSTYNGYMGEGKIVATRLINSNWKPVLSNRLFTEICKDFLKINRKAK